MLSPDARTVAMDLLRPPTGYRLDVAVLTTYSLDLEAMLALPLAVLAQADGGIAKLLEDPLLLLEALREAGDRIHIFVDKGGIAIPRVPRALYAMLESSLHMVQAPNGGAFHPKVWVARFSAENQPVLLRVAVLSRNLTFDYSWDVGLVTEGSPGEGRVNAVSGSKPLGGFLRALPTMLTGDTLKGNVVSTIEDLAGQVERTKFPAPAGFSEHVVFYTLGLGSQRLWVPQTDGARVLAVSPFVNTKGLNAVAQMSKGEHLLISRQEELDKLSTEVLSEWNPHVLMDSAEAEPEDGPSQRPSGLHAKMVAVEHGWDVTWYVGSANITAAAFTGTNVEVMASIRGRKGRVESETGFGIQRFLDQFMKLCVPYKRGEVKPTDPEVVAAQQLIEKARDAVIEAPLKIVCTRLQGQWQWQLRGKVDLPKGVQVTAWPLSVPEAQAQQLALPLTADLPMSHLTAFVAFHLKVGVRGVDDIRLVRKLPTEGLPDERIQQVLRSLIDSPEKFLRFLRALLGGLEGMVDWGTKSEESKGDGAWGEWITGETLLEDLLRTASRDPARLDSVRRLITDLRATEEGRAIVPDDLFAVWSAVDGALGGIRDATS